MIQVPFRGFTRTFAKKAAAWIGFSVILAGLLLLNVAYHHFLRQIAPAVQMDRETFGEGAIFWLWCVAICLQPAVVEELFFRYLSLGALRSVVGVHSAVWLSAMMFALAHIYVPLSLPVLFCLGVGLGYARVASGGMALPMVLHLLHNAAVMYLQSH
jgi:membrane protease YdiL (CAAX protease family)